MLSGSYRRLVFVTGLFLLLTPGDGFAIDAQFKHCVFRQPGKGPYVETYLSVNSRSIAFARIAENSFQGSIEVTIDFSRNDTIVVFDKYVLKSPVIDSNTNTRFSFLDLQRFRLDPGMYTLHLKITDTNDSSNTASASEKIEVLHETGKVNISDLMLASSITPSMGTSSLVKSGLEIVPRPSAFYGNNQDTLQYYLEVYGTEKLVGDSVFIVKSWIENGDGATVTNMSRFYRKTPGTVIPLADALLIDELPSGNYFLKVEVRSRLNDLLASRQLKIQRLNNNLVFDEAKILATKLGGTFVDKYTRNELLDHVKSLRPITQFNERQYADNLLKNKEVDEELLKRYMLSFWEKRNPGNPRAAWETYYAEVQKANQLFSSKINRGYATERGRVYLQYGVPNSRTVVDNEPSAYPYEIWWYYEYQGQRNIRFVFYNPDLITNDYVLLHSEALGETFDPQWRLIIFSRTTAFQNLDDTQNRDHFGTRLEENYRNQ